MALTAAPKKRRRVVARAVAHRVRKVLGCASSAAKNLVPKFLNMMVEELGAEMFPGSAKRSLCLKGLLTSMRKNEGRGQAVFQDHCKTPTLIGLVLEFNACSRDS